MLCVKVSSTALKLRTELLDQVCSVNHLIQVTSRKQGELGNVQGCSPRGTQFETQFSFPDTLIGLYYLWDELLNKCTVLESTLMAQYDHTELPTTLKY